ncbi:MAG: hypothetical protein WCS65_09760 [Verrucomicrobiae bacterium]
MNAILQWLTGEKLPPGELQSSLSLQGLPPGWALLLFLIGTAGIIWSYRAFAPETSRRKRNLLAGLRVASFALVILFLLKPVLSLRIEEPVRSALLVMFDNSRSMQIVDKRTSEEELSNARLLAGTDQPARSALVKALATNASLDLFPSLAKVADLQFESFGAHRRPLGEPSGGDAGRLAAESIAGLTFDENSTAIGDALVETLTAWRGAPVAGVLLVTDGASNSGSNPLAAARVAAADRVPLFIYATGVPQAHDLRVLSVTAPPIAFLGEPMEVRTSIRIQGYPPGTSARVSLRQGDKVIGEQSVKAGLETTDLTFQFVPEAVGSQDLCVVADPLDGEAEKDNNTATTTVRVVDQKVKLLYIEQHPRWDFRFIANALKDDRRVELKCHVIEGERGIAGDEGKIFLDALPEAAELLSYQVVLLGDVSPEAIGPERMQSLAKLVGETGGGLLFLAGPEFNPAAYQGTPLEPLLPVDLAPVPDAAAYARRSKELQKFDLTPAGEASPLLKLADSAPENRAIWSGFAGVRWVAPFTSQKPTAETLLTTVALAPVIATQPFGRGQTLYFGTDETYRWRSRVGAKHFIRIWTQIIQTFALERLQGASDKIQLRPDQPIVFVGDTLVIAGHVFDDNFKPLDQPRLEGEFVREGASDPAQAFALDLSADTPGLYSGKWTPRQPGSYLFVPFRDRKAVTRFQVRGRDAELLNPVMEKQALESLAAGTKGKFLMESDLAKLPELLKSTTATIPRRKTVDLYALWPLLLLAALLLFAEWTLRRLSRLK